MLHFPRIRLLLPIPLLTILLVSPIMLAACSPTAAAVSPSSTPAIPSATIEPATPAPDMQPGGTVTQTPPPVTTAAPADITQVTYNFDLNGVAQSITSGQIVDVQPSDNGPWYGKLPAYINITLEGYPISEHIMKPQVFIFPAQELSKYNEYAGQQADELSSLLASQQGGDRMPFMPPENAAQVMHAQVQFLDFKTGKGVRFLTQFDQALLPINNQELFYTYQGLTSDGKYYVAAILPVNLSGLPANGQTLPPTENPFWSDFAGYMANIVKTLNEKPPNAFTPDLSKLDAMMQSLEVK